MRFMFRIVFWGFIGLMILPSIVDLPTGEQEPNIATVASDTASSTAYTSRDAMGLAFGVAGYMKDICAHEAELCKSGGRLAKAAFERARQGALVVAKMVETHRDNTAQTSDPTTTSSIN